ncbi:MAG: HD domain-containing protein [bacterium]|nr:HD domain-containing protein [bacterium]
MLQSTETYWQIIQEMKSTDVQFDQQRLESAWEVAQAAYRGHDHWTGEPLMKHVLGVLRVLLPFQPDEDAVIACLLCRVLQTKYWTLAELEESFGSKIRELVSGVHLLSHITLRDRRSSVEDLRMMLLTVSDDIRTILIILCNRCYLLSSNTLPVFEAKNVAQDALQLFAPVAARLGIYNLKNMMESLSFPTLYPTDAERLEQQLLRIHKSHGDVLGRVSRSLQTYFEEHNMDVEISVREKQLFSIFRKMKEKSLTHMFDLHDLFAVRVVVKSEADCYRALGLLHQIGRPVPNRFKDYIAFPKPNGYQSLHTTLMQLPGTTDELICVEAQIRTEDMHREAEFGVASHWMYKQNGSAERAVHAVALHNVLSAQQELSDGSESSGALADHIFVLTPHEDIVELPAGATPLDLAFQIHTDLGLAFRGARVNGSMVTIDYHLENGDVVEILKNKTPTPSPQWMKLLKMASSRSRLKRYLYAQNRPQFVSNGRIEVNKVLRKHHLPVLDSDLSILRKFEGEALTVQQREDILMKIGQGSERASVLLTHLDALKGKGIEAPVNRESRVRVSTAANAVEVEGGITMPTALAKCCKPTHASSPDIKGVVSRMGHIKVHKAGCRMLRNANTERLVRVWWV